MAASAIAKRSLKSLKMDTRRWYLCGYLVCIDCWSAEYMDTTVGRVAAIVVCTQCRVCVNSCDYSEVYAPGEELNRGPVKVVENQDDESPALLLTEFLTETLMNLPADSADRAAVLSVVRTLLQQSKPPNKKDDDDQQNDIVEELGEYLSDKRQMPELETCVLANAEQRNYVLDQPNEPAIVPPMIIPPHEEARLQLVNDEGLMLLANQVAPIDPSLDSSKSVCDVSDLDVLCQLAVRETGCSHAFVTIMGSEHQHILSSSNQSFGGATMPREHTFCQHTIMTSKPLMVTHPEADVRFHELDAIKARSTIAAT